MIVIQTQRELRRSRTMRKKEDRFSFTAHALERALERMLDIKAPYSVKQYQNVKELILKNMEWNPFDCIWELREYEMEFIIRGDKVVTITRRDGKDSDDFHGVKPICEMQKSHNKKYLKLGRTRNGKSKNKKGRDNGGGY